ncbi:MAG: hypothetical protein ACOYVK_20710 [Bacillota bacterium]
MLLVILIIFLGYILGYRLTGLQAAKIHFTVGKNPKYIDEVKYDWGTVFLFDTEEGPRTIISKRHIFVWVARTGFHMKRNSDNIRVIGWGNNENCTVYVVQISDEKVSYIEMGKGEHRIRKYKDKHNRIVFSWNIQVPWNDLNGIAYSYDEKKLYEFRYPKETKVIRHDDLRWYAVGE